ncbi:MAG: phosphate ABC transporter permease PstA [Desulfobacterales bacterium]|nr:phosphate ABC transporter permease PstA [Desulfobacterales bacterium]
MEDIRKRIRYNTRWNYLFTIIGLLSTMVGMILLCALMIDLAIDGAPRLSCKFLTSFPSRFPEEAGILSAWVGSFLLLLVTALAAIPLGIAAGLYLEEYGKKNWLTDIIEINIANLAGVPSIVYGLLALGLFVYFLKLGESILTGGLTLALLILPMVIMATREAIRAIPNSIREASYALGATKWQTVQWHIIPYSTGGILTGIIIGLSRAIGETAPIITVGALTFIAFLPTFPISAEFPFVSFKWLMDPFTVMPIQMFNWVSRPQEEFQLNAAAAGIILMMMTLLMNGLAIYIRYRFRKKIKW